MDGDHGLERLSPAEAKPRARRHAPGMSPAPSPPQLAGALVFCAALSGGRGCRCKQRAWSERETSLLNAGVLLQSAIGQGAEVHSGKNGVVGLDLLQCTPEAELALNANGEEFK